MVESMFGSENDYAEIERVMSNFQEVSLSEIHHLHLTDRKDTKFVFKLAFAPVVLRQLQFDYKVLSIHHHEIHPYTTIYYDTNELWTYHQHQNGKQNRFKIRVRRYDASDTNFVEVKCKTNRDETLKKRVEIPGIEDFTSEAKQFVESETRMNFGEFHPILTNRFDRITLVNHSTSEKLTLDLHLSFQKAEHRIAFPDMVVAEVKQSTRSRTSPFFRIMKTSGIRPISISKYCMGMIVLTPGIKFNSFKSKILQLQKYRFKILDSIQ